MRPSDGLQLSAWETADEAGERGDLGVSGDEVEGDETESEGEARGVVGTPRRAFAKIVNASFTKVSLLFEKEAKRRAEEGIESTGRSLLATN